METSKDANPEYFRNINCCEGSIKLCARAFYFLAPETIRYIPLITSIVRGFQSRKKFLQKIIFSMKSEKN
jgi:hypothetical protein